MLLGRSVGSVIEQIIRRLAGIMRTALMLGLIAAAGVSLVALTNFIVNDGDISGFDTLLPSNRRYQPTYNKKR